MADHQTPSAPIAAPSSDYGSEFDDDALTELFSQADQQPQPQPAALEHDPVVQDAPPALQHSVVLKRSLTQRDCGAECSLDLEIEARPDHNLEVEYSARNRAAFTSDPPSNLQPTSPKETPDDASTAPEQPGDDPRAPLERFRRRKPLSVTDLVSPAWCEQQYWYSLTRFGRVRKTKAMRQGSSVHKVLEEQVHREVRVDVQTREDMFGLRVWNVVQGLRTLRATGLTRELEVWGLLGGEVVNGIIDEVSAVCPDEDAEARMLEREEGAERAKGGESSTKGKPLEAGQKTLPGFFKDSQNARILEEHFNSVPSSGHEPSTPATFYITDIKTRQSKSLPPAGSQSKPVYMQLMLYRRLLSSLAANEVPAEQVFERYSLDPHATFSDTFIAEIGQLDFNFPDDVSDAAEREVRLESRQDSVDELLAHNSLASLWTLMVAEFARTIPHPTSNSQPSISRLLAAEYRSGGSGALIGRKPFVHDDAALDTYVEDEVRWWRGERATKGVDIEDAFKCRICEFAEGCSWREEKIEEAKRKARLRAGARKSQV
ncbi:hypothetical protein WHR41_04770 [Cladosporium halotolerans]|uniref:Exonuclease V n=1 Tax=Cladosporium halotolerans TaxID=1052096 RepID=A0AB34KLL4_9PEZI